jgi:glycopeptide antibiotics resistance protein
LSVPQLSTLLRVAAWVVFAGIVFVTLSPIGLRPVTPEPPNIERAAAFLLFGLMFALAYPRRLWLVVTAVVVVAVGLELLQLVAATRHARLGDAGVKLLGGGAGLMLGVALNRLRARR